MPKNHSSKAEGYRRKARSCAELVAYALSGTDRASLLRMRESYLSLAANEEWLDGSPPTSPPHAVALMAARN